MMESGSCVVPIPYARRVPGPFDAAFAKLDHATLRRAEFAGIWADYVSRHPWEPRLRQGSPGRFEVVLVVQDPAPAALSLVFSEWLAAIRGALDNGLYALAIALSGQDPPPGAGALQFPIATTPQEFRKQAKRLATLPPQIVDMFERAQPYQSPEGPESNLLFWVHQLARTDRHRTWHLGLGAVEKHRVRVGVPPGTEVTFDETVNPYDFIDGELVIARFTTSPNVHIDVIDVNPGVEIAPEIKEWARFRLGSRRTTLAERMHWTEIVMRNHVENLACLAGEVPLGGFSTIDPSAVEAT